MDNQITKYENNFFGRILNKIKSFFCKAKIEENIKESVEEQKANNTNEAKQKFVELVRKFNAREIEEKDLTPGEVEQLMKYYKSRDKELDEEIARQKKLLENLNIKLNRLLEKVINLKV